MTNVLAEDLRETVFKYVLEGHLTGDYEEDDLAPIDEELFKDFLIPKNWGLSTVKESCYIHARIGWQALSKREHLKTGDYMLITGTDFQNGLINYSTCVYVSKERYDMDEKIKIQNDDILITKDGTLGKVAVVKDLPKPATLNGGVFVVRPDERFNKEYVEIIFNSSYFGRFINDIKKSTTIKHLNQGKLQSFLIPVPPIEEQQRIVDRVNELMVKIDEYEKLENQLVQLKKQFPKDMRDSLLQAAIQGKLTNHYDTDTSIKETLKQVSKEKERLIMSKKIGKEKPFSKARKFSKTPFDIPHTWEWVRFGNLMVNKDSYRIPVSKAERAKKEKIFDYYGASGVIDKIDNYLFDEPNLLIGEDGANLLSRSTPIAFIATGKYWVNNHAHVLNTCAHINLEYIQLYINAIDLSPYVSGTAQPKMNQENMNAIWVALPPIEEQQRIVDKLDEMLPLVDALAQMD